MRRLFFRAVFGGLLLAIFGISAWISFQRSILGRSILVPHLVGKAEQDARKIARDSGLTLVVEKGRERYDERVASHAVLLQQPGVGSFVKPGQAVRVVLSLGPRSLRVPDLAGLSPRAAGLSLLRASLALGEVSTDREYAREPGIFAQAPEPDTPASEGGPVAVLYNRGAPDRVFVMPGLVGRDAKKEKERLTVLGFRVGATRYESYEGLAPDTILKQYPPAGYPVSQKEAITLTAARPGEAS